MRKTIKVNPIGPPIWCIVLVTPLAAPESSSGISFTPAEVTGARINPCLNQVSSLE